MKNRKHFKTNKDSGLNKIMDPTMKAKTNLRFSKIFNEIENFSIKKSEMWDDFWLKKEKKFSKIYHKMKIFF